MKKLFCLILAGLLAIGSCFANSLWHFKSGSSEMKYKYFYSAEVHNNSGWSINANGTTIFNGSTWNIYSDDIVISSDSISRLTAFYEIHGSKIIIYINR